MRFSEHNKMAQYNGNYMINRTGKFTKQKPSIDAIITAILCIFISILISAVILLRVHLSVKITDVGYKINAVTREKIRLAEEKDRLLAEIAYLKSTQNLRKMATKHFELGVPESRQILRVRND